MDNLKDRLTYVADIFTTFTLLRADSRRRGRECYERQYIITEREIENMLLWVTLVRSSGRSYKLYTEN